MWHRGEGYELKSNVTPSKKCYFKNRSRMTLNVVIKPLYLHLNVAFHRYCVEDMPHLANIWLKFGSRFGSFSAQRLSLFGMWQWGRGLKISMFWVTYFSNGFSAFQVILTILQIHEKIFPFLQIYWALLNIKFCSSLHNLFIRKGKIFTKYLSATVIWLITSSVWKYIRSKPLSHLLLHFPQISVSQQIPNSSYLS